MTIAITRRKIFARNQSKKRLNVRLGQSYHRALPVLTSACAMWFGRIRKHSISDASKTTITVKGISEISAPKRPPMAVRPTNARTVVMVAENTGIAIRLAAFSEASVALSPRRRARKSACSATTMASSTTMPRQMISANSENMLIVRPDVYISAIVASMATGIPAATQIAARADRKMNSSPTTSARPRRPLSSRISRRSVISSARVRISSTLTPAGMTSCISSATSVTVCCMPMASP